MRTFAAPFTESYFQNYPAPTITGTIERYLGYTTQTETLDIVSFRLLNEYAVVKCRYSTALKNMLAYTGSNLYILINYRFKHPTSPDPDDDLQFSSPVYFLNDRKYKITDQGGYIWLYGDMLPAVGYGAGRAEYQPVSDLFDELTVNAPPIFSYEFNTTYQNWPTWDFGLYPDEIIMRDIRDIHLVFARRYLARAFNRSSGVLFINRYFGSSGGSLYVEYSVWDTAEFDVDVSDPGLGSVRLTWVDETGTMYETVPITTQEKTHHLGFIPSTASYAEINNLTDFMFNWIKLSKQPYPVIENGDMLKFVTAYGTYTGFALVEETYNWGGLPGWNMTIRLADMPGNITPSGSPSNRTNSFSQALETTNFDGFFDATTTTPQAALEIMDDHLHAAYESHIASTGNPHEVWIPITANVGGATIPASSSRYIAPFDESLSAAIASVNWPGQGTARNFTIRVVGTQPASGSLQLLIRIGTSETTVITINPSDTTGNYQNTTDVLNINNLNAVGFKLVNNATAASIAVSSVSFQFLPG